MMEWEARMKQQKQERGKAAYEAWVQLKQEQSRAEQKEKHRQKGGSTYNSRCPPIRAYWLLSFSPADLLCMVFHS